MFCPVPVFFHEKFKNEYNKEMNYLKFYFSMVERGSGVCCIIIVIVSAFSLNNSKCTEKFCKYLAYF